VFTYGGEDGLAFSLNDAAAFAMRNGEVKSSELVLRSAISTGAVSRSQSKNAFKDAVKLLVMNMKKSMYHRLEIQMLYGQSGIGEVEAVPAADTVKIEDHEWAAGIWNGSKGAKIDIYDVTLATLRGTLTVLKVDYKAKTVQFTAAVPLSVVATDKLYFEGSQGNEFIGLHEISQKSGLLFGINNAQHDLFQGNIVDVGANYSGGEAVLSFEKCEEAVAAAMEKGLGEESITILCNPRSWNNLLTEQDAKRMYDSSYSSSTTEQGTRVIKFFGMNGEMKIIASTFIKEGYAYAFVEKDLMRIGSSDVTFELPGLDGQVFRILENQNGIELRAYSDQALVALRPATITQLRYIKS
jgi:hypothetical protein